MIIDAHTHGMHGEYLDRLADSGDWGKKQVEWLRVQAIRLPQSLDVALRVRQIEEFGIDLQMVTPPGQVNTNLMPAVVPAQLAAARALNENMARLVEDSRGKLFASADVPITNLRRDAEREMERAICELGLRAVALPTNIDGKPLDSPEYDAFWAKAEAMDVPVYLHPWPQRSRPYEDAYGLPHMFGWPYETTIALSRLVFSGVMERYPKLTIVCHHLGGMIPFFLGRVQESIDPSSVTTDDRPAAAESVAELFSRFYYDCAVGGSPAAIRCAYEVFGADRLIFATDSPYGPGGGLVRLQTYPQTIKALSLPPEDVEKILNGNAVRILKVG